MNETLFSLRATRSSKKCISWLLVVLMATAWLALSACRGGAENPSSSAGPTVAAPSVQSIPARTDRIGVPVLDAVAFGRPSEALAEPTDSLVAAYGDLLFNQTDLLRGYVFDDQWCYSSRARCVAISDEEGVHFGGEPLESFVLDPEYHVDDDTVEVVDLRALHHPVSDHLLVAFDIKATNVSWDTRLNRVKVTSAGETGEYRLDGPLVAARGVLTHYELRVTARSIPGPVKVLVPFSGGIEREARLELEIDFTDDAPEIERTEPPLDVTAPAAIYRSKDPLPEAHGASENADQAIQELIGAIVDGQRTSGLVVRNSPGALAVAALSDADFVVTPRRDPTDPMALCWSTYARGAFCERWHGGITKGGALTSWSVEGTPIDELVERRSGSIPGSSLILVRSMTTDVVLARTTVNDTATELIYGLRYPRISRANQVRGPLVAFGSFFGSEGDTVSGSALIESSDFSFDVKYRESLDEDDLFFYADLSAGKVRPPEQPSDLGVASAQLASQLQNRRFDAAVAEAAPGSPAATYLRTFASVISQTQLKIEVEADDEQAGSTRLCLRMAEPACSTVEVTALDDEGRIRAMSIEGVDTEDLIVTAKSGVSGNFEVTVDDAISWPNWGVYVNWSVKNGSQDDVRIDSLHLLDSYGLVRAPDRPVFDDIPAGGTVSGVAVFENESLEDVMAMAGSGRDEAFMVVVPFRDRETTVEFASSQTDFKTPAGTKLSLPGVWTPIYWFDDETGNFAGDDTTLNRANAVRQGDITLIALAPDFSPASLSTDEIIDELGQVGELTNVVQQQVDVGHGESVPVIEASTNDIFPEPSSAMMIAGTSDLVLIGYAQARPEDREAVFETVKFIIAQVEGAA